MSSGWETRVGQVTAPGRVAFSRRTLVPREGEVLIRVAFSAICGSDLHIYRGRHPSVGLPAAIGHEFSGRVAVLGPGVEGLEPEQRVTVEPCVTCGSCGACRRGDYGYCESISFTYRMGDGAMADYVRVRAGCVHPLPEDMSLEAGALIEPMAVATHAVRRAQLQMGERVLVLGAGAIGLMVTALCRHSGAGEILAADRNPDRLALARELGADHTVNAREEDVLEAVSRWTGGAGVDKSFECVGHQATLTQGVEALRKNGLCTVVGIFEEPGAVPAGRLVTHELRVQGSQGYCWDFPTAMAMARRIGLERFVTHRFPLDRLGEALVTCCDPASGSVKVLLHP